MRLLDLTLPLGELTPGYPGDPPVRVRQVRDLETHGFRLHELCFGSHAGTHVNAPWHMAQGGARLEELPLACFVARAVVAGGPHEPGMGVVFADAPLTAEGLTELLASGPAFVAQAAKWPLDEAVERALCEAGIASFENLANTHLLPRGRDFLFAGLPLAVQGDGAPVRAVAILEEE